MSPYDTSNTLQVPIKTYYKPTTVDKAAAYVHKKNIEKVRQILTHQPNLVDQASDDNRTLLTIACRTGQVDMCVMLIDEFKADVNHFNKLGSFPLYNAVGGDHFQVVKLLVQRQVNLEQVNEENQNSSLDLAIAQGFYRCAQAIYQQKKEKKLRPIFDYQKIKEKYYLRYVNFEIILKGLNEDKEQEELEEYLTKVIEVEDRQMTCCEKFESLFVWKPEYKIMKRRQKEKEKQRQKELENEKQVEEKEKESERKF